MYIWADQCVVNNFKFQSRLLVTEVKKKTIHVKQHPVTFFFSSMHYHMLQSISLGLVCKTNTNKWITLNLEEKITMCFFHNENILTMWCIYASWCQYVVEEYLYNTIWICAW